MSPEVEAMVTELGAEARRTLVLDPDIEDLPDKRLGTLFLGELLALRDKPELDLFLAHGRRILPSFGFVLGREGRPIDMEPVDDDGVEVYFKEVSDLPQ